jgi:hypothetical protein
MKVIRYLLLAFVVSSVVFENQASQMPEAGLNGLIPPLKRQRPTSTTEVDGLTKEKTVDELKADIKELRRQQQNKAQQLGRLRNGLRILVSEPELVELESKLAKATKAVRGSRSGSSSARRKLENNMGDADLAARLRAHTQQANESAAEKQKLEKERDALLRRTADATQQRRLKRLNAENGQLEKERRELERDLDEVLTQS